MSPPHHDPDIDDFFAEFLFLAIRAMWGAGNIALLAAVIVLGLIMIALVIAVPVSIIMAIREFIEAHRNRSHDCENGDSENSSQDLIEDDGPHITEEEVKESFDEDARTIVGEEHGMRSVDLSEKGYSEECCSVFKEYGQHSIKEDTKSFDADGQKSLGEENGKSSLDLTEKLYLEENYPLLKDDGQHSIKEDKVSFDEGGRKSLWEEYEKSSVDLVKCYLQVQ